MSVKKLLKDAREAINSKDYQLCQKLCKDILNEDKTNYMGLVFFGISLQEVGPIEQAANAFKKAIQLNPSNILGYNGLCSFYEQHGNAEEKKELPNLYKTILHLDCTDKKILECAGKIFKLQDSLAIEDIVKVTQDLLNNESADTNTLDAIRVMLNEFLSKNSNNLSQPMLLIQKTNLQSLIKNSATATLTSYLEYISVLYKLKEYELLLSVAENCYESYEHNEQAAKWMCKVFNMLYVEANSITDSYKEKIFSIIEDCKGSDTILEFTVAKSIFLYESSKLQEARVLLQNVTSSSSDAHAWILLSRYEHLLSLLPEALNSANYALELLSKSKLLGNTLTMQVNKLILDILSRSDEQSDWMKAVDLYANESELRCDKNAIVSIIRANIKLGRLDFAENLINHFEHVGCEQDICLFRAQIFAAKGEFENAISLIEPLVEQSWEACLEIGNIYWNMHIYDKSVIYYLKAAKLNPSSYQVFIKLGTYYENFGKLDKARRCFEKAFKLNGRSLVAATELNKIYKLDRNWTGSIGILQNFTNGKPNGDNLWAWIQLGLTYYEHGEFINSINTLRIVIRLDPDNTLCLETLGDAYLARGAYTSAVKTFQRVLELNPAGVYSQIRIASIQQLLGQYSDAKVQFQAVLNINKLYIPALKGLAETFIGEARDFRKQQLWGLSRDSAQRALDTLSLAIKQYSKLSCLWKLLGDAVCSVTRLSDRYCCLLVYTDLLDGGNGEMTLKKPLELEELYEFAIRCYSKSIVLTENNILIWHDLAMCLFSYAKVARVKEVSSELYDKAFSAAHYCVVNNPSNWTHWNLMGVITYFKAPSNFSLSQHSFIKSTMLEKNCTVAWCNLGTLYLRLNELKLANEAFSQAQRCNPNYVNSWVGQALIAESLCHEDCMDLFRHSAQLGCHSESQIGYGYWVCKIVMEAPLDCVQYSIQNMHAIPVACDALTWYTELHPDDSCGWNMLGLLRERMGLKGGASRAFKESLVLSSPENRDQILVNYGRSLIDNNKFEEAINVLKRVQTATFNSGSTLALGLFKGEKYEESYSSYDSALHWLTENEGLQSNLLVALASMAYLFQGPEEAKTLLFQSLQLKPPSPWGLYATMSLGLLHQDFNLAELALNEMGNIRDKKECLGHYTILTSYFYMLKGQMQKAIREVSKLLHRHPYNASLWLSLSMLLIKLHEQIPCTYAAAQCAHIAMELGQTNMDITNVLCLVSLGLVLNGDNAKALKASQKAIHYYPNVVECWAILISALRAQSKLTYNKLIGNILEHIKKLDATKVLLQWIDTQGGCNKVFLK